MKFVILGLILPFALLFFSCQENNNNSPTGVTTSPTFPGLLVVPDSGYIGSHIHLFGVPFDSLKPKYSGRFVYFSGLKYPFWAYYDNGSDLFVEVPFGAQSGPINIKSADTSFTFDQFKVLETSPETGVVVKHYNLNYPIREQDSYLTDFNGTLIKWQANVHSDTITLFRKGVCGDECTFKDIVTLLDTHAELPKFIEASRNDTIHCCIYHANSDTVKAGILKIQDFNVNGVISGKLFYKNKEGTPTSLVFWYDFKW